MMKWNDEIVEEVRQAREAYAARFDCDLKRIFEDLKKKEEESPAPRANLEPLKPQKQRA
jgi:hypothetical protein